MTRSDKDYAVEHAEYLAKAAEDFLASFDRVASMEQDGDAIETDALLSAEEARSDNYSGLKSAIYEFRKRAERAKSVQTEEARILPGWVQVPSEPPGAILGFIAGEYQGDRPHLTRDQARTVWNAILAQARTLMIHAPNSVRPHSNAGQEKP